MNIYIYTPEYVGLRYRYPHVHRCSFDTYLRPRQIDKRAVPHGHDVIVEHLDRLQIIRGRLQLLTILRTCTYTLQLTSQTHRYIRTYTYIQSITCTNPSKHARPTTLQPPHLQNRPPQPPSNLRLPSTQRTRPTAEVAIRVVVLQRRPDSLHDPRGSHGGP